MKMIKKFCLILIMTVLLFYCKGDTDNNGENGENGNGNNGNGSNTRTEAIIVDHNHTDIAKISDQWIEDVKKNFVVHYAHTSHGGQIVVGLQRLSGQSLPGQPTF